MRAILGALLLLSAFWNGIVAAKDASVLQFMSEEKKDELINKLLDERINNKFNRHIKSILDFGDQNKLLIGMIEDGEISNNHLIDDKIPILTYSILSKNNEIAEFLLRNPKKIEGETLRRSLEIACSLSNKKIVALLVLGAGVDPNKSSNNKDLCIFAAIDNGNLELVRFLKKNGIDEKLKNDKFQSPTKYLEQQLESLSKIKSVLNNQRSQSH